MVHWLSGHAREDGNLWQLCLALMEACLDCIPNWYVRGFYAMTLLNWLQWDLVSTADRTFACRILSSIEPFPHLSPRLQIVLEKMLESLGTSRRNKKKGKRHELRMEAEECIRRWKLTIPEWHLCQIQCRLHCLGERLGHRAGSMMVDSLDSAILAASAASDWLRDRFSSGV